MRTGKEMRFSSLNLLWACLVMILSLASIGSSFQATGFEVGQVFPDLLLPSLEASRPMSLGEFRGKKLILHIFASW